MTGKRRNYLLRLQANVATKGFLFVWGLQRCQLVIQHVFASKKMRLPGIQSIEQQLPRAVQIENLQSGGCLAQPVAIIAFQGRAADDQAFCLVLMLAVDVRQGIKPLLAIVITKRFTSRHLGDIASPMMVICIDVRDAECLSEQAANKRFAGP